ncbi:peptidoglycan DD-metalloendopeptidase family protein [Desulfococcaceae bacterium HSG8]|nr:peptidoglycan DD-metalloendopeptidase family protein [Desulfococcaceae bacterium HSG8]
MKSQRVIRIVLLCLLFFGISDLQANVKIKHFKKEAENIDNKIEKNRAKLKTFDKKENNIISSLHKADLSLSKARNKVAALRSEIAGFEKKIAETTAASEDLMKQIQISEDYASRRMAALYKLNRLGKIHILASSDSVADFFQRKMSLERILSHDENTLENLTSDREKLRKNLDTLNAQKKEKLLLEADFKKQAKVMTRKKAERSKLLADIRKEKSLTLAVIESLKRAAGELDRKIQNLRALIMKPRQIEPDKNVPPGKFSTFKGLLKMPVEGKIISFFGPYENTEFKVKNFQKGIDIKSERGKPVQAVCEGRVIYSGWFKGYGNMIIIDHGDHYYTLYAHAEELFKKEGDNAEAGEVIATVGDTGSMGAPGLHFEIRHHGKAMNPMPWLKKG